MPRSSLAHLPHRPLRLHLWQAATGAAVAGTGEADPYIFKATQLKWEFDEDSGCMYVTYPDD
ncbi:uncharacterized protein LOC123396632 [Hordeum vulgare subsp. vulgare]|uniref:Predicted protein n=1 Tax=Hordeum vulgare subsp. vulgare TaxID=112509 RepID=F2D768_HORVV|nr:uncharacterized protein LOC123396632 [Hordeum vulgare subsp. vulgare]BAJ90939.1 predicted protein [Hordeum vulgare subsp. vulgare]